MKDNLKFMITKSITVKNLFIAIFSTLCFTANATTYYFAANGNDNNSGTTSSSPWQSLNKLNSLNLQPGDNVLFRSGDTFYGGLK